MTSDDTINKYIREVLRVIINDPSYLVIKADQNAPRPETPYCTVKVLGSKSASLEETSYEDSGATGSEMTSRAMRSILVSFNFFKSGIEAHDPFYVALLCRQALSRDSINELLGSKGLGLAKRGSVRNLTFELDNGFEERASFTATFNYVDIDSDISNTIGTVDISGSYKYETRTEDYDLTV